MVSGIQFNNPEPIDGSMVTLSPSVGSDLLFTDGQVPAKSKAIAISVLGDPNLGSCVWFTTDGQTAAENAAHQLMPGYSAWTLKRSTMLKLKALCSGGATIVVTFFKEGVADYALPA